MATKVNRASLDPAAAPSPAFSNASSVMAVPFASGAPMASTTVSVPAIATTAPAIVPATKRPAGMGGGGKSSPTASPAAGAAVPMASANNAVLVLGALLGGALAL